MTFNFKNLVTLASSLLSLFIVWHHVLEFFFSFFLHCFNSVHIGVISANVISTGNFQLTRIWSFLLEMIQLKKVSLES